MPQSEPDFFELLRAAEHSVVHLELRDSYAVSDDIADEAKEFKAWRNGHVIDWSDRSSWWNSFHTAVIEAVGRGVVMRRARVVSEPVTEYIRYEHYLTTANITAGELVRWLPRRQATDIAFPGNDFWLFDGQVLIVNHFTGDGQWAQPAMELYEDQATADLCASAFEAVWERAVPHEDYQVAAEVQQA
ncbi:DUF6879 family protein [Kitasatospora sp. P5_F3]